MTQTKNAVILLSGGLDSTVMLAMAMKEGRNCIALTFNYGQKHRIELQSAMKIVKHYGIVHHMITLDPQCFANSALTAGGAVPKDRTNEMIANDGVAATYVPARNTIFLAYATAFSEVCQAEEIYLGANSLDVLPYPDCRQEFFDAFQGVLNVATKQAQDSQAPRLMTPISGLTKNEIVKLGRRLNAPIELTWSCYEPAGDNLPCQRCDACLIRADAMA